MGDEAEEANYQKRKSIAYSTEECAMVRPWRYEVKQTSSGMLKQLYITRKMIIKSHCFLNPGMVDGANSLWFFQRPWMMTSTTYQ